MVNVYTILVQSPGICISFIVMYFVPSTRSEDGHYCIAPMPTLCGILMNSYEAIVDAPKSFQSTR